MSNLTHRAGGGVLLAAALAFASACEAPTGPSSLVFRPDFATQSTLTHLTLSRGDTTLVSASGVLPSSSVGEESLSPNHPDTSSRF